jgi:hypothetical protein
MKIERLAGIGGEPEATLMFGGGWCVIQDDDNREGSIFGPGKPDERSAIRAWNTMVRRIRKLNAGEKP